MSDINNIKKLFVCVKFNILYGLFWEDDILVNMHKYFVRIITKRHFIKKSDRFECSGDGIQIINDRQGKLCKTEILCLLEFDNEVEESDFYLSRAVKCVNRMLEVYRNMNKDEFYISKVIESDLDDYYIYYILNNGQIEITVGQNIEIGLAHLAIRCPNEFKEIFYEGSSFPLWVNAIKNARNYYDLESYSQAIIEANICLENFVYTHIYERLKNKKTVEEINDFLSAKSPCNECNNRSEEYELDPIYPSIRKVIKYMYNEVRIDELSNRKLNMLIDDINKYRNEVVHGRSQKNANKENAKLAVEGMEKLISLSMKVTDGQITLNQFNFSDEEAELLDNSASKLSSINIGLLKLRIGTN